MSVCIYDFCMYVLIYLEDEKHWKLFIYCKNFKNYVKDTKPTHAISFIPQSNKNLSISTATKGTKIKVSDYLI